MKWVDLDLRGFVALPEQLRVSLPFAAGVCGGSGFGDEAGFDDAVGRSGGTGCGDGAGLGVGSDGGGADCAGDAELSLGIAFAFSPFALAVQLFGSQGALAVDAAFDPASAAVIVRANRTAEDAAGLLRGSFCDAGELPELFPPLFERGFRRGSAAVGITGAEPSRVLHSWEIAEADGPRAAADAIDAAIADAYEWVQP